MDSLAYQVISYVLDGEYQDQALLFDQIITMSSIYHGTIQIVNDLLVAFSLFFANNI